jgi:threonine dehydrogenase-like Zn-dependent dehydrogenase
MRAVIWHGPGDLQVEDRPVPSYKPGKSIVAVTLAGICATDRELTAGRLPDISPGFVLGHEITGVIVAGDESQDIHIGDRVVIDTVYTCGVCESCTQNPTAECLSPGELGFTADGGWAQYVSVDTHRLHKIPNHFSWNEAVLIEPFACPLGALLDSKETIKGMRVLVVGGGIAAIAFASAAFALGARQVEVCLRTQRRSEIFRAIHPDIHLTTSENLERGVADISIDSVGNSSGIQTAVAGVKNHGLVICYGFTEDVVKDFPLAEIVLRNLRLSGHTNPKNVWPSLIHLLDQRAIATAGLVDRVITIEEVPQAVAHWEKNLRTVIQF